MKVKADGTAVSRNGEEPVTVPSCQGACLSNRDILRIGDDLFHLRMEKLSRETKGVQIEWKNIKKVGVFFKLVSLDESSGSPVDVRYSTAWIERLDPSDHAEVVSATELSIRKRNAIFTFDIYYDLFEPKGVVPDRYIDSQTCEAACKLAEDGQIQLRRGFVQVSLETAAGMPNIAREALPPVGQPTARANPGKRFICEFFAPEFGKRPGAAEQPLAWKLRCPASGVSATLNASALDFEQIRSELQSLSLCKAFVGSDVILPGTKNVLVVDLSFDRFAENPSGIDKGLRISLHIDDRLYTGASEGWEVSVTQSRSWGGPEAQTGVQWLDDSHIELSDEKGDDSYGHRHLDNQIF